MADRKLYQYSCADIASIFGPADRQTRSNDEIVRIVKWAQVHIPECPSCSQKYDTMGTVVEERFKNK